MPRKTKKLWGGRFSSDTLKIVDEFNASIPFDWRLYPYDIQGSIAHCQMLGKQGVLSKSETQKMVQGLKKTLKKIQEGKLKWSLQREDVHLNIESHLTKLIGPIGGKLHTARSRNDQVATDLRLFCRDQVQKTIQALREFQKSTIKLAKKNIDTLLPGYTHLQRAQPISLAHHLLAYFEMAERDIGRLQDSLARINTLPLGSGALAGTTFKIDRKFVAKDLGFSTIARNSLDAVSDRDFVVETLSNLSLVMMHLSRLAEEWILWATQEFGFIKIPEEFCTGSSMMPQKINPDVLELIRGKTGRVYGALHTLLVVMKGLPLTYNKDMQEDKEPFFDAMETTQNCLKILTAMIEKTEFNKARMKRALGEGFVLATDLADYLVRKGLPFREAHHTVGKIVAHCHEKKVELNDLSLKDFKKFNKKFGQDLFKWLDYGHSVDRRSSLGGTARKNIKREIRRLELMNED